AVPAVFTHDSRELGGGRLDVVTTLNSIDATVGQFTTSVNYGVHDRIDVSVAVPFVRTTLSLTSNATIQRLGTTDPAIHFYRSASGGRGNSKSFTSEGTRSGIGDLIFRVKGTAYRGENVALAVGTDFRAPTGDEENLLGSGAPGVKPFAAVSFSHKAIAPHVNVGYQWNGNSVLAGDIAAQRKADLPDQFLYTAGVDVGATSRLTIAFDVLGQRIINSPRLVASNDSFSALSGSPQTFPNIQFRQDQSFNVVNGAIGFKVNPAPGLLLGFNLLFKMNDSGLRDKVTPLFGFEYSF
ncbi:MAG: transporter, partial [Acidobacteria bacterium]|nr:transporter [Acidobacteriota bacterium]